MTRSSRGTRLLGRLRRREDEESEEPTGGLAERVRALEAAVEENRQLSQRLADVVDVVTEVLVPAADRDDERLRSALADLGRTLNDNALDGLRDPDAQD